MSKIECTAVNELIDLVQRKPLDRESEEELLFSAPPAARAPKGTQPPPLFGSGPVFPIDAPALPAPRTGQPPLFPVEISSEPTEMRATIPHLLPLAETLERPSRPGREDDLETVYVARQQPIGPLLRKLALPAAGIVAGGIAIGIVIALATHHAPEHATHVSAPSPFVAPALAAAAPPRIESIESIAPAAAPAPAPAPAKPAQVEIRLESDPPGATATLVDNGATTPLGTTPVDATVDPAKQYDIVFALEGRPTKSLHLDPSATQHLAVALEVPPAPEPVVASKPAKKTRTHRHHAAAKHAARVAAAAPAAKRPADRKADKQPAAGTLAVVTTPPCAILIDGQNSGLTSPQRAISLPAGHHSVRLIAATAHVNKLVAVDVEPRRTTRLVQDFTK